MAVFTSAAACPCCNCLPLILQCRKRGGVLELCGVEEFVNPSTPPRIYKVLKITGSMSIKRFPTAVCGAACAQPQANANVVGTNGVDGWNYQVTQDSFNSITGLWRYKVTAITGNVGDVIHGSFVQIQFNALITSIPSGGFIEIPTCTPFSTLGLFWSNNAPIAGSGGSGYTGARPGDSETIDTWNFSEVFIPPSCAITTEDSSSRAVDGAAADFPSGDPEAVYAGAVTVTESATQRQVTGTGACQPDPDNPGKFRTLTGTVTTDLSEEHTEDEAIAYMRAHTDWGAWRSVNVFTCANPACCLAQWELRTGRTFVFVEAQYRATQGGFVVSTDYSLKAGIWRRPFGVGQFRHFQTNTFSVNSHADGTLNLDEQDTPNDRGFETYAHGVCAVKITPP